MEAGPDPRADKTKYLDMPPRADKYIKYLNKPPLGQEALSVS